ncbi:structural toxin protein RtxA [Rhizoctonia solani AG-3 Rhs1AP]|uniref:ATP phosphoribosyltransferase n=1 Tax=Rhizoctonia solani AG-3 Rhs1AP TaxID=1086054 RepID=X8JHJ9_9AGAM|nr:structural toxin protein RtxA [Rhizoctonia solani AG-3 Rhs1AP]
MHLIYLGCDHHKMSRYKFVFFSPVGHTQRVLSALFNSVPRELGAIGLYQECAFVSKGTGQFRPMTGASPSIGGVGQAETVEEEKAEVLVSGGPDTVRQVIQELRKAHPYEEPAYDVYKLEDF